MCGIYLFFSQKNKIKITQLYQHIKLIQHRGQDSYGLCFYNENKYNIIKKQGCISDIINNVESNLIISHLRYKTSGSNKINESQPILSKNNYGEFLFVFNGNIPINDYTDLYDSKFTLDTDLIQHFLIQESKKHKNWDDLLKQFINTFERAYSIIVITEKSIYILKDRYGIRPLCYSVSSDNLEICSESIGIKNKANKINELLAGEIIKFNKNNSNIKINKIYNILHDKKIEKKSGGKCLFEYIYFMSPDTVWDTKNVGDIRSKWSEILAIKDKKCKLISSSKDDYIVIGIPSTGIIPGKTYANKLGISYTQAITKNTKIKRTFILDKSKRDIASKQKYIYNENIIKNKKIIIIDDSIVRGITIKNIISSLKSYGALEIHLRINSPPVRDICKYGIDIPTKEELIAYNNTEDYMNSIFGSTSLKFLDLEDMKSILNNDTYCTGCFNSNYGSIIIRDKKLSEKILSICNLDW